MKALTAVCLIACVSCTQSFAQEKPLRTGSVVHLRLNGDLECMQGARDLKDLVMEAQRERCALIVLETGGNESRIDVVRDMCRVIRDSEVPVVVYLADDADKTVGAGQLCLGQVATDCIVSPDVVFKGRGAGAACAVLAPEDTHWSVITEEVAGWIKKAGAGRGLAAGLEGTMISPGRPVWGIVEKGVCRVVMERPAQPDALALVVEKDGQNVLSVDARTAVKLHMASTTLGVWTMIPAKRDLKNAPRVERVIGATVAPISARVVMLLDQAENSCETARQALKLAWPPAADVAKSKYRAAAKTGKESLEAARVALTEAEQLLEKYPEVMRRPAPDQTEVGGKGTTFAARWRSMVQSRRDKVAKLNVTVGRFETVGD